MTLDNTRKIDTEAGSEDKPQRPGPNDRQGTVSIRVSTMLRTALVGALVVALGVLSVLWWSAKADLRERDAAAADDQHALQVGTDYAIGASTINYQDFNAWLGKLKANTAPELATKFDATGPKLQEILTPLKWTSNPTPITAKVMSEAGGVYKVDVFLNVSSTSAQTPEGGQTTVTYNVTIDKNADWKITDVGGLDGALPAK